MSMRTRIRVTNTSASPVDIAGRWLQPGASDVFDFEQVPPAWRAGAEVVSSEDVRAGQLSVSPDGVQLRQRDGDLMGFVGYESNPLTGEIGILTAGGKAALGQHVGRRLKSITDPVGYIIQPAGNNASSFGMALNIPGGYDAVQLGYTHAGGAGACVGFKAIVAATDNIGDKSLTATADGRRFVTPWRAGVESRLSNPLCTIE